MELLEKARQSVVHLQHDRVPGTSSNLADYFSNALKRARIKEVDLLPEGGDEKYISLVQRVNLVGVRALSPYEVTGFQTDFQLILGEARDNKTLVVTSYAEKESTDGKKIEELLCVVTKPRAVEGGLAIPATNPFYKYLRNGTKLQFASIQDGKILAAQSIGDCFRQYVRYVSLEEPLASARLN